MKLSEKIIQLRKVNSWSQEDLAEKLKLLIENKELRIEMGKKARCCAEEKFDRKNSYVELVKCIVE